MKYWGSQCSRQCPQNWGVWKILRREHQRRLASKGGGGRRRRGFGGEAFKSVRLERDRERAMMICLQIYLRRGSFSYLVPGRDKRTVRCLLLVALPSSGCKVRRGKVSIPFRKVLVPLESSFSLTHRVVVPYRRLLPSVYPSFTSELAPSRPLQCRTAKKSRFPAG